MQPEETKQDDAQQEKLTAEDIQKHAQDFAEILKETDGKPIGQIAQLIEKCGLDFVQKLVEETEELEASEGVPTHDKKRRRTKGGVFFFLAKGRMDPKIRQEIFPNFGQHIDGEIIPDGIEWAERLEHIKQLTEEPGQINNLTVTLIGRPGKIHIEGGTVMTVIEQKQVKAPPYPKGVPPFESVETLTYYYVFMGLKHWQKVESSLEDETDMLIIEGTAVYDHELEGISILSTGTSTKLLERQKRLAAAQQEKEKAKKKDSKKQAKPSAGKSPEKQEKETLPADLTGLPQSVSDKLTQLHSAAETLRQKIEVMEEKGQKTGLNMTRRLLEQTEKQIATLEKQFK